MTFRWKFFLIPGVVILILLFILPQGIYVRNSVAPALPFGKIGEGFTFDNYLRFFTDPFYLRVMAISLYLSSISVLMSALMGYPMAYSLARSSGKWTSILTSLILLSSFVTITIKVLGWSLLLRGTGPINQFFQLLGLIEKPLILINNQFGVFTGMVHFTLPVMVLTLTSVIQAIPRNLEFAAINLGCSPFRSFIRVVLPLSLPGFLSACLMNFCLCMGLFATPALLGGGKVITLSDLIHQQVVSVSNHPFGAAISVVLLVAVLFINVIAAKVIFVRVAKGRR